ncbi:MAG: RNA-dependent DNA polymerase [Chloroflexi bacterium]|nr:RNA-dependent DNA polymerase [Chloroflexota bacterium]
MKPVADLYPQIYDWENLERAYHRARAGKRGHAPAAGFERTLEDNLVSLQDELRTQTYRPGAYHSFYIHEPKHRLISAAPFRDRVAHHALCAVIEPLFERRFIFDSYANRVGKGTHRALDRCQQFSRRYSYALQLDVVQFFPSIDHELLRTALWRVIGDEQVLGLCDVILAGGRGVQAEEYRMVYFPGDDPSTGSGQGLLAANRPRGLPIGNLTSQFWANVYLDALDQFVKRELKCRAYARYVDDLVLFADSKRTLWEWRAAVVDYLAGLRLTVHIERAHPRPVAEGLPFLGFTVFPTHRRLKAQKAISFRRKFKGQVSALASGQIALSDLHASVRGWINHVQYGDTWGLRRAVLGSELLWEG